MRSILLVALTALACTGTASDDTATRDGGPDDGPQAPLTVSLGEGLTRYAPLPDEGAEVELVLGPQGGWHFDLATRLTGASPDGLTLDYAVRSPEGATLHLPARVMLNARRVLPDGDGFVRVGDRAVLDVRNGSDLVDHTVELSVVATDARGRTARDTHRARVVDRVP